MMNYVYCAATNAFYPEELKALYLSSGSWPKDGITIEETIYAEYSGVAPSGKTRAAGADGLPCWADLPPLSADAIRADAEVKKAELLAEAAVEIAPLKDAVDMDIAADDESQLYNDWRKYRVLVNRVDTSQQDEIVWPERPLN